MNRPAMLSITTAGLLALAFGTTAIAGGSKIDICHYTGNGSWHVVNVSTSAASAHFANHGDVPAGTFYPDADGDGFGDGSGSTSECPGAGFVDNADDCDDTDASTSPDAAEVCDDGVDNDCDGEIDEGCTVEISNPVSPATGYNYEWGGATGYNVGAPDAICRDYGYTTALYWETCGSATATGGDCNFTVCEMWYLGGPDWVTGNCDDVSFDAFTYIECE